MILHTSVVHGCGENNNIRKAKSALSEDAAHRLRGKLGSVHNKGVFIIYVRGGGRDSKF